MSWGRLRYWWLIKKCCDFFATLIFSLWNSEDDKDGTNYWNCRVSPECAREPDGGFEVGKSFIKPETTKPCEGNGEGV